MTVNQAKDLRDASFLPQYVELMEKKKNNEVTHCPFEDSAAAAASSEKPL